MAPVDLHLFARQGAEAQVGFRLWSRPVAGNQMPKVIGAPRVAARLDHLVDPRCAQTRELKKRVLDKWKVGINGRRTADGSQCRQASLAQHARNAVAMHMQLGGDGANRPVFGVVVAQDLRFNFRGEGHAGVISCRFVGDDESDDAGSPDARM